MLARKREISVVVVKRVRGIPRRVACKTGVAFIHITIDTRVLVVCFWVCMAGDAGKISEVVRVGMAFCTLIPLSFMCPAVNGKILGVVVESSRYPFVFCMTGRAIVGELCCLVVGVGGIFILTLMASVTSVRCVVIVAIVASSTLICNGGMSAIQCIIIIVDREVGRFPVGLGCVAHGTVGWYGQRSVIRVGALVKIILMAACAGVWCIIIVAVDVAQSTLICDSGMFTC